MRRAALIVALVTVNLLFLQKTVSAQSLIPQVTEHIKERILTSKESPRVVCMAELICSSATLPRFYVKRSFSPAWINDSGPLPQASSLLAAIAKASQEGMASKDYHLATISSLMKHIGSEMAAHRYVDPGQAADLDLLLTDTFLIYASHLLSGRVNPETLQSEWFIEGRKGNVQGVLENALQQDSIEESLRELLPPHADYGRLKNALAHYRSIVREGGWPLVPHGPPLRRGDHGLRVEALRAYLIIAGDLADAPGNTDPGLFDEEMDKGIRRYQYRHGLNADGVVGPATQAAIDVPAMERVRQIEVNMEQWRWLPADFGDRYVRVNIADFTLAVIDKKNIKMKMRAVVGKNFQNTPVFTGLISYLELNPYWNIPTKIAVEEMLPAIRRNSRYLAKQKIRVYPRWAPRALMLDPSAINWSCISKRGFPYRLRQDPGPRNPLGRIKFMFPNKFSVYIHGTPHRHLFEMEKRDFSHGCIRIEKPMELAAYLLQGDPCWNRETLESAIKGGKNHIIRLADPIPVHILYFTSWVDEDGTVHFRNDIYGRDSELAQALGAPAPRPK
jgi:L,D-transpeptidase YcbB